MTGGAGGLRFLPLVKNVPVIVFQIAVRLVRTLIYWLIGWYLDRWKKNGWMVWYQDIFKYTERLTERFIRKSGKIFWRWFQVFQFILENMAHFSICFKINLGWYFWDDWKEFIALFFFPLCFPAFFYKLCSHTTFIKKRDATLIFRSSTSKSFGGRL